MKKVLCALAILLNGTVFSFARPPQRQVIPLDSVFALAERNSTQLKLSESAIDIKEAAVGVAKNARLPSVEMSLAASYYGSATIWDRDFTHRINSDIPDFGTDFGLHASYVVFAGGAIQSGIEKSELEAQIVKLAHEKNRVDIRFLIAGNYLNLYKLYNQKKVFEKNIEQTDEVIRQVKTKLNAGMALDNDLTRYELMLQNMKLGLTEIENNISIVNQHLTITLGLPDETVIIPDSSVQQLAMQPIWNNAFYKNAIDNRQEIKIQKLHIGIAQKDVKRSHADRYPTIALVAANYFTGPILVEVPTINKNLNYWHVGIEVKYNIGALFTSKKNIAVARNAFNTASITYDAEVEKAKTAIHAACIHYAEAHEKLDTYKKSYELASQNYSVIKFRYENDLALITEMLDASNMKLKAELQVINAKLDVVYQLFTLLRETGTL